MNKVNLGAFSISLSVKNLQASKDFYEKLGFVEMGGNAEHGYLIMRQNNHLIGLFENMFEGNLLTFNPGWDQQASNTEQWQDIRSIQQSLQDNGVTLTETTDPNGQGIGHISLKDPDGNVILIDQHREN